MITNVTDRNRAFYSDGETGFSATVYFTGSISDVPTTYENGDVAYCFAGADKGKAFMFDKENLTWEEL